MTSLDDLIGAIKSEAEKIDQYIRSDLESIGSNADRLLIEVLEYGLLSGGKRIRPLLAVLSSRICGATGDDAYRLGCAFEYLHAATLFHDDIIDNSLMRRGNPSVFTKFGTVAAILAGDFLHALSMSIVGQMAGKKGLEIFCRATTGMVDGEFMQMRNAKNRNMSELDYYDAIMGKTGLLISAACEVGACYAGGSDAEVRAMKEYGVHLGCAFQIVDDLLDYQGDAEITGKSVGNDLLEGKMTLPLIQTLNAASDADKFLLVSILKDEQRRKSDFSVVYKMIEKYEGFEQARRRAEDGIGKAVAGLSIFDAGKYARELGVLQGLAGYVLNRKK